LLEAGKEATVKKLQKENPLPSEAKSRRRGRRKGMCLEDRPVLEPNAAGIDVGAREMFVAVPPGADEDPVRVFTTFTEDLHRLADWLAQCGVTTVAMEATGVYWIPLYEILEQRGIRPCLVNARHMKNVPGRRTDWHECQWLQFLHSVGLLRAAFRPEEDICAVRTLLRHRSELVMAATQHVQHMHKALTQMNLQIHHVISDITGATGLAIVDAILAGQRDPAELAKLRDVRIKADPQTIGNRWWVTGERSICSRSDNRVSYIGSISSRSSSAMYKSKQCSVNSSRASIQRKDLCPRPKTESDREKKKKENGPSESRIRSAYGSLQTLRR
jgi:hypothetical protein